MSKLCSKCNVEKQLCEFYATKNGPYSYCKDCSRKLARAQYWDNHEQSKEKAKLNNQKHKERVKKYNQNYSKQLRVDALNAYGKKGIMCACCGENEENF